MFWLKLKHKEMFWLKLKHKEMFWLKLKHKEMFWLNVCPAGVIDLKLVKRIRRNSIISFPNRFKFIQRNEQ